MNDENPKKIQERERLFFHDIINQTHGLILFLNQRSVTKKNVNAEEVKMLEKEVRTLQSLIKDHFEFTHKNLHNTLEWVSFSVAEEALLSLIRTYLPVQKVKTYIELKGDIKYDESLEKRQQATVYFPVFYRIMNNLIKNIAEAQSTEVHFILDYGSEGLFIETQNLSILSNESIVKNNQTGLGLESILYLTVESGGSFSYEKTSKKWISRISLPGRQTHEIKKAS